MPDIVIVSLNVCSLVRRGRVALLYNFIRENNPDIVFLQETQIDEKIKIKVPGYNVLRGDVRRGWGGTAILTSSNIPIKNLKITTDNIHSTSIECKISETDGWTKFTSFYFPNGLLNEQQIANFFIKNENAFMGGDTNARHTSFGDVSSNQYGNFLKKQMDDGKIKVYHPNNPTCFHSIHGSFIDKFISNHIAPNSEIVVIPSFSDHFGIKCSIPFQTGDEPLNVRKTYLYNKANLVGVNRLLEGVIEQIHIPVRHNIMNGDCENIVNSFSSACMEAVNKYVPYTYDKNKILLGSLAMEIHKKLKTKQRKLFKLGGGFNLPPHVSQPLKNEIKMLRGMLHNAIHSQTSKFFSNIYNSINDNKSAFGVIKRYTGHKKKSGSPSAIYNDETKTVSTAGSENLANLFANNFVINNELTLNIPSVHANAVYADYVNLQNTDALIGFNDEIHPNIVDTDQLNTINGLLPVEKRGILTSTEEITNIIKKRPNKNSTGYDGIPNTVIKNFSPVVLTFITVLFNHLLSISYFPTEWQKSIITPIPKPGRDTGCSKNWRPISLLSSLSKIFERIIAARIIKHNNTINIYENQFGFLNGNSTIHALAKLQNKINRGLNMGQVTTIVALDLRAAFDTVWHAGLVHKMIKLKYPIGIIKLIGSFLSHRKFVVRLDNSFSSIKNMLAGVPQGSVLVPICFNIYTHDIPTHGECTVSQFADDTVVYITHNNPGRAQGLLNWYLMTLANWFKNWKLQLNSNKTELIHILGQARDTKARLRKNTRNMKNSINGKMVRNSNNIRFLGLQL